MSFKSIITRARQTGIIIVCLDNDLYDKQFELFYLLVVWCQKQTAPTCYIQPF